MEPRTYRIGELARTLGLNPKTLRYYESVGLLPRPARSPSGYRIYTEADAARLRFVRKAKDLGLRLREIRALLQETARGKAPCRCLSQIVEEKRAEIARQVEALLDLDRKLAALTQFIDAQAPAGGRICPAIEDFPLEA
ncbi:MerR family transcriptional regulator [Oceanithermus sp.]|uniref:MerR family transcriptional regulator n=1 Tax=Oceanithermus sp. TaxID=2268145 RepID=UPI002580B99E|nr:MerR family transcriptional regulator [Oceanithermus sp.]